MYIVIYVPVHTTNISDFMRLSLNANNESIVEHIWNKLFVMFNFNDNQYFSFCL